MTKQLNKKGTSLVELIAVIVIMGIIAGIAIPTTIAVINRQKKNAAEKSVESVLATAKDLVLEAQADATSGTVYLTATYAATATPTDSSFGVYDGTTAAAADKKIAKYKNTDMVVDGFKGTGTITATLGSAGTVSYGGSISLNGYTVTVNPDGSCSAS